MREELLMIIGEQLQGPFILVLDAGAMQNLIPDFYEFRTRAPHFHPSNDVKT